jgi:hypothetical protein
MSTSVNQQLTLVVKGSGLVHHGNPNGVRPGKPEFVLTFPMTQIQDEPYSVTEDECDEFEDSGKLIF